MANADEFDSKLLDAALQVDWGMHNLIIEAIGNRILESAHQQNFDKIKMIRLHGRSPRYLPLAMEEHLAVIEALQAARSGTRRRSARAPSRGGRAPRARAVTAPAAGDRARREDHDRGTSRSTT